MKLFERQQINRQPKAQIALPIFLALVLGLGGAQTALAQTPAAGMTQVALIPIHCVNQTVTPNCLHDWTTSGATQASTDIFSFDLATNTMYFADRVNQGITVIDTRNNKYLGTIPVPSCNVAGAVPGSCPSGVQVVHDQRKLIVTDRNTSVSGTTIHLKSIFIYDFTIPDDGTIATGGSADGVYVVDPTKTGPAALSKFISAPTGCAVRGIDIDPVTNTGVIGCAAPAAQFLLDFNTATIPTSFPRRYRYRYAAVQCQSPPLVYRIEQQYSQRRFVPCIRGGNSCHRSICCARKSVEKNPFRQASRSRLLRG